MCTSDKLFWRKPVPVCTSILIVCKSTYPHLMSLPFRGFNNKAISLFLEFKCIPFKQTHLSATVKSPSRFDTPDSTQAAQATRLPAYCPRPQSHAPEHNRSYCATRQRCTRPHANTVSHWHTNLSFRVCSATCLCPTQLNSDVHKSN